MALIQMSYLAQENLDVFFKNWPTTTNYTVMKSDIKRHSISEKNIFWFAAQNNPFNIKIIIHYFCSLFGMFFYHRMTNLGYRLQHHVN